MLANHNSDQILIALKRVYSRQSVKMRVEKKSRYVKMRNHKLY